MSARRALLAAAAGVAAWAAWIEPRRLVVRRETLALAAWPRALDGLRVGLMTDIHGGVPHMGPDRIARAVERMRAERPDVVLLLGDFVDAHPLWRRRLTPEPVAAALGRLDPPLGAFAVLGNHDTKRGGDRVRAALERAGVTVLENRALPVPHRGGRVWIAGLADLRRRDPDVARALRDVPADGREPVVLMAHDPDLHPCVPARVALTVAGHIHAGQVAIPLLRRPAIPSRHGERYARRHHEPAGRRLYVSSGLGTSGLPVRLLAPPEIVVATLVARQGESTPSCDRIRRRIASDDA